MKTKTIPARYEFIPQPIQSFGVASASIPFAELVRELVRQMAREAVGILADGLPIEPREIDIFLEDAQLDGDTLSLEEWCRNHQPIIPAWDNSYEGLKKLAGKARDLAADDGPWQDDAKNLRRDCLLAVEQIMQRAEAAIQKVLRDKGNIAAQQLLAAHRQKVSKQQQALLTEVFHWDVADREALEHAASRFARLAIPRTHLKKFLAKRSSEMRATLTGAEQKEIGRLMKAIQKGADKRFRIAARRAKLDAFRELLGDNDHPGRLQSLVNALRQEQTVFDRVGSLLESETATNTRGTSTEIRLVENLQSPVDQNGTTLGQLYRERAEQAGWNSARLAAVWRDEGVLVNDELVDPHEWSRHAPAQLAEALLHRTRIAFGSDDGSRELNLTEPRSVLEHCATLNLAAPELRRLVMRMIPTLVDRSAPYALCPAVGTDPKLVQKFVFCHPTQRHFWHGALSDQRISEPDQAAAFAVKHPFVIVMQQVLMAGAIGASRQWQRWMSEANRAVGKTNIVPLKDRREFLESRLLRERVRDHDDCVQLLAAASKAGLVYEVGQPPTGWTIAKPDPRIDHHFAPRVFTALWQPPETIHQLLKTEPVFVRFVQRVHSELINFRAIAAELSHEHDSFEVAERLRELGIIERRSTQYRMMKMPSDNIREFPRPLYRWKFGALVGLSLDDFHARLLRDDDLYNIVFWSVLDAFQLRELTENDVPASIVGMDQLLR